MVKEQQEENPQNLVEMMGTRGFTKIYVSTRKILVSNFLGGLAWGFGVVLGATVVVTLMLWLLNQLNQVPVIGEFVSKIIEDVQNRQVIR